LIGQDHLYVYWINTTVGPNNNQIEGNYSTDYGANWIPNLDFTPDNFQKGFLTSVYYAPIDYLSAWHWTRGTAGNTDVHFERIPEFQDIVIPFFSMIIIAAVWGRRRKK
jgi:hypothetical protein